MPDDDSKPYEGSLHRLAKGWEALRKPLMDSLGEEDLIQPGETKVGVDHNNIVLSDGRVEINNENSALGGYLGRDGSDLKVGGSLKLDAPLEKLIMDGKFLNPQMKYRPTNVVSHYPPVLTLPATLEGNLLRGGVLCAMMSVLKFAKEQGE